MQTTTRPPEPASTELDAFRRRAEEAREFEESFEGRTMVEPLPIVAAIVGRPLPRCRVRRHGPDAVQFSCGCGRKHVWWTDYEFECPCGTLHEREVSRHDPP